SSARPGRNRCGSNGRCASPGCGACSAGYTRNASGKSSVASPASCCWDAADQSKGNQTMRPRLLVVSFAACTACARPAPQAAAPNLVTITATDYAFGAPDTIPAGLTTLRLVNQGKELHHASLVRLGNGKTIADFQAGLQAHEIVITALTPGKTLQDFIAWEQGGEKGPLPTGVWLGGVTALEAGGHAQFTATLAPGNYLILCFWPDAKDGKPHLMHGMGKQITVS